MDLGWCLLMATPNRVCWGEGPLSPVLFLTKDGLLSSIFHVSVTLVSTRRKETAVCPWKEEVETVSSGVFSDTR